jgi:hypothetical protein
MVIITVFPQSEINKQETLLSMLQTKMNTSCTLVAGVNMQGKIFISELENHYTNFSPTILKEIRAISFFSQQEILVVRGRVIAVELSHKQTNKITTIPMYQLLRSQTFGPARMRCRTTQPRTRKCLGYRHQHDKNSIQIQ